MIECGKELIKLLGSPAWVQECCTQSSCALNEFTLPVKWVIGCPFLVDSSALNGAEGRGIEDVFRFERGEDIIIVKGYVHEIDASTNGAEVVISHSVEL